jgi:hypothetical protein
MGNISEYMNMRTIYLKGCLSPSMPFLILCLKYMFPLTPKCMNTKDAILAIVFT